VPAAVSWNPANAITVVRICLVPLVVGALVVDTAGGWRLVATGLFVVAALSDRLDGYLARRMDQVTDWGKLADPIADKLLMGGTLVTLSALGDLPWWVTVVIGVRELGITALRLAVLRYVVIPASRGGKVKTALQSVGIGLFVLPLDRLPAVVGQVAWVILLTALVATVVTGVDYVRRGWAIRGGADRSEAERDRLSESR
jgi:CDP-diacylglycerol--glycerol-3-phosphate 3-phosphatidyltransferase